MSYSITNYLSDFISEDQVKADFKKEVNNLLKCKYSLGVTNGTVAIEIPLKALNLPLGSVVIVPEISFIATATAVANCGLIPVYADVSNEYFGITLDAIKEKYTQDVRAVIVVHFSGFVNREIIEIKEFCKQKNIYLIEDCAQAFLCSINNQAVGTIGDIGTTSFQSSKILSSGEGGLIVTDSDTIAEKCSQITNWGLDLEQKERNLEIASSNFRLSAIQCYFIKKQIEVAEEIYLKRINIVDRITKYCKEKGLEPIFPKIEEQIKDCPFFFPIRSEKKLFTVQPSSESPMSNSTIVKHIYKTFYPYLLERYLFLNKDSKFNVVSRKVLKEIDFINIYYVPEDDIESIFKGY